MHTSAADIAALCATLLAGSELLALLPNVRSNSWIQLLLSAMRGIAGGQPPRR